MDYTFWSIFPGPQYTAYVKLSYDLRILFVVFPYKVKLKISFQQNFNTDTLGSIFGILSRFSILFSSAVIHVVVREEVHGALFKWMLSVRIHREHLPEAIINGIFTYVYKFLLQSLILILQNHLWLYSNHRNKLQLCYLGAI